MIPGRGKLRNRHLRAFDNVVHLVIHSDYMSTGNPVSVLTLCNKKSKSWALIPREDVAPRITEEPITCLGCLAEDFNEDD